MRTLAILFLALAAGCASMTKPPADAPPAVAGPVKAPAGTKPAPRVPATPAPAAHVAHVAPAAPVAHAAPTAPAAHAVPAVPAAPAAPAAPVAQTAAAPRLDLKGLEQRLKATKAIGIFTKLALKNQVDDLLAKFRAYHEGRQPPTLTDLRPNYELLLMKVQSLIQKDDPVLSDDIARSREVIWSVLADKNKFSLI